MNESASLPLEYLLDCSDTSLRMLELSRLDHVAGLKKEARQLFDVLIEEAATALLARWLLENRARLTGCTCGLQKTLDFSYEAVADCVPANCYPDRVGTNGAAKTQR